MNPELEGMDTEAISRGFRHAMRRLTATVTVLTTTVEGQRHAMTATAVTSVSMVPPALLACVNRSTAMHDRLQKAETFCVNLLFADHRPVAVACSGRAGGEERFSGAPWDDRHGLPALRGAQANIFCRRTESFAYGSHVVFFGEVFAVATRPDVAPLLYQDGGYAVGRPLDFSAA
jgi:flavin reductase (DIM6/NTAB) family NADH-FMN oxidoreductase RutF